tara:strand:- start:520 stop:642 length:123 start_codon:yes stop_codon:yes gene_type:complete
MLTYIHTGLGLVTEQHLLQAELVEPEVLLLELVVLAELVV